MTSLPHPPERGKGAQSLPLSWGSSVAETLSSPSPPSPSSSPPPSLSPTLVSLVAPSAGRPRIAVTTTVASSSGGGSPSNRRDGTEPTQKHVYNIPLLCLNPLA